MINYRINDTIFQEAVNFYSKTLFIPALAAKIYSVLLFDFRKNGVTFDEICDVLHASKSSVSTNLNLLLNAKLIKDINKMEERKRYFIINDEYLKIRFSGIITKLTEELKILNDLNEFRSEEIEEENEGYIMYKNLLENNIKNIEKSLNKL